MGYRPLVLLALPLLLTAPALAQQQEEAAPVFTLPRQAPPADPGRQGPELDVYRGAPVKVTPPPVVAPTVTPPPPVVAPQPTPQAVTPQSAAPTRPAPSARQASPAPPVETPAEPPTRTPEPEATAPLPQTAPQPTAPATQTPREAAAPQESGDWRWIAAGAAALAALLAAAWLLLRRRSGPPEEAEDALFVEDEAVPQTPAPAPPPAPRPAAAPPQPASSPANDSDRPWIDLVMEVRGARLSLMGATIDYSLTLRNRGARPADDLLVRTLIANADAHQQQALQQFFAGTLGLPSHSVVSIAPGQDHVVTGQLRLLPDQIAPVRMGERSLLIPLVAFDVQYRWKGADRDGHGRSARAFIVGQEASPPTERLAPFRLDMGPRQFRTPGSRATALELAS